MCSLCGTLGGSEHWTAGVGRLDMAATRRGERAERVRVANGVLAIFHLKLDDWQGSSFVLNGPTGQREIVDSLPDIWRCALRMTGRAMDPLDPQFLMKLGQVHGSK